MLVLFETSSGYAIFKVLKDKKLDTPENVYKAFERPEKACKQIVLQHFEKFYDVEEALKSITASNDGKLPRKMKQCLKPFRKFQETLAVGEAKLGSCIQSKMNIPCVSNTAISALMRMIRIHLESLMAGLPEKDKTSMTLGVAHSMCRYKFKFSPDKIDKMVIEAVSALDELDKEINNYIMRCKEWYGWHFPELCKLIPDNTKYIKIVVAMGMRENGVNTDLSEILTEEEERKVKEMAEISMGTEIMDDDIRNMQGLCQEVLDLQITRTRLYEYLKNRMVAVAPNVALMVGEMVGARLMAHAGSLVSLAKQPASTVQILGAEKALFRALKARHDTPKYGLIYHAQLIGQSGAMIRGKMSRMLAAKTALAARVDAFGDDDYDIGTTERAKLEQRIEILQKRATNRISGSGKAKARNERYENKSQVFQYKGSADSSLPGPSGDGQFERKPFGGKRKFEGGRGGGGGFQGAKKFKREFKQEE